jgi:cytochrome bd-type quinol oxidase subunit 2
MPFKKIIIVLALVLGLAGLMFPDTAAALFKGATDEACQGVALGAGGKCEDGGQKLTSLIKTIINLITIIVGIVSVIMIIVGGLKYITSAGDSNKATSAKNTIVYAVIGLVVVAFAQIIVRFVVNASTKP